MMPEVLDVCENLRQSPELKLHKHGIVIRIGKFGVYVVQLNDAYIIGNKKAVNDKHLAVGAVRHITVAAGGNRLLIVII